MSKQYPFNVLRNRPMVAGAVHTKDANVDDKTKEAGLTKMSEELGNVTTLLKESNGKYTEQAKTLKELRDKVEKMGEVDGETQEQLTKAGTDLAEALTKVQACETAIETIKKNMDSPIYKDKAELKDSDIKAAIELQKRAYIYKGGEEDNFQPDMDNLVDAAAYRSAAYKLMQVGLDSKAKVIRSLSENERKAFEAASLDTAFFMPEMLGMELDCTTECAQLIDLYNQVTVSRSTFMFPHVTDYGEIGKYDCDAKCDAEYGPEGNIAWRNGQVFDWRGMFCFQRDTLREANYDLLGFMMRSAARSRRINRNRVLITGDGINEPKGWLTTDCFTKRQTAGPNPTHIDFRKFIASAPVEYGAVQPIMHQNTFAYFASMVDNNGRFLFGDGLMTYSPSDVRENIRISNCLPDPTDNLTRGTRDNPFVANDFIMAAGVWKQAYSAVEYRPMFMEQYEGGSTAWCVSYQFGAKDGGFVMCCPAARQLHAGT